MRRKAAPKGGFKNDIYFGRLGWLRGCDLFKNVPAQHCASLFKQTLVFESLPLRQIYNNINALCGRFGGNP